MTLLDTVRPDDELHSWAPDLQARNTDPYWPTGAEYLVVDNYPRILVGAYGSAERSQRQQHSQQPRPHSSHVGPNPLHLRILQANRVSATRYARATAGPRCCRTSPIRQTDVARRQESALSMDPGAGIGSSGPRNAPRLGSVHKPQRGEFPTCWNHPIDTCQPVLPIRY